MKKAIPLWLGFSMAFSAQAGAMVITFDDLARGVYGDTLTYGNATIKSQAGGILEITDQTADGFGNAYSLPNKLCVWGNQPLTPKEKTSFVLLFSEPIEEFSFWLTGTFHDTTVIAFDANGSPVETFVQTYPQTGPTAPDGSSWDYYYDRALRFIDLDATAIRKVSIQPAAYDGFSIDHVSYQVIPEPSTLFLLTSALLSVSFRRRKK